MPSLPLDATWRKAWADRSFRFASLLTAPALVATLSALAALVKWVERRPGAVLADPVLALLAPRDVTWPDLHPHLRGHPARGVPPGAHAGAARAGRPGLRRDGASAHRW